MNSDDYRVKEYLAEYLESKGINTNRRFSCLNPNHEDKNPSMQYYQKDNKVHCFACGADYSLIDLLMIEYDVGIAEAFDIAKWKYGGISKTRINRKDYQDANKYPSEERKSEDILSSTVNLNFQDIIIKAHQKAQSTGRIKHFLDRGISERIIEYYQLGYVQQYNDMLDEYPLYKSKSKKQILYNYIIPFINHDLTCSYFIAELSDRLQQDAYTPKYLKIANPYGICPAQLLNERYIKNTPLKKCVFVTEGVYDAFSLETVGHHAIGLIGTSHRRFIDLCRKYQPNTHFVLSLDNDDAGCIAANKIAFELAQIKISYSIDNVCGNYKDPNEALLLSPDIFARDALTIALKYTK